MQLIERFRLSADAVVSVSWRFLNVANCRQLLRHDRCRAYVVLLLPAAWFFTVVHNYLSDVDSEQWQVQIIIVL